MAAKKQRPARRGRARPADLTPPFPPERVIPPPVARAVADLDTWFVIGGHAVRCFCPYRPSHDVDFGVGLPNHLEALLRALRRKGRVEILERLDDTVHLRFDGINVSVFVLRKLAKFTEGKRLGVVGLVASKLHAILDRGTRRDFFDLYVTMHVHRLGIVGCLAAMRAVYGDSLHEPLLLKALTHFDDAEREAALPGEGEADWRTVKDFFISRVGQLLVPPTAVLVIQRRVIDVT